MNVERVQEDEEADEKNKCYLKRSLKLMQFILITVVTANAEIEEVLQYLLQTDLDWLLRSSFCLSLSLSLIYRLIYTQKWLLPLQKS